MSSWSEMVAKANKFCGVALKNMLVELHEQSAVVLEVIDKVIQGVCKQLQNVSLRPSAIWIRGGGAESIMICLPTEHHPNTTRCRAPRHPFPHLHTVLGTALDQAGAADYLSFRPLALAIEFPTTHSKTKYRRSRLPRPYLHQGSLQGTLGAPDRGSGRWDRGDGDRGR